MFGLLRDWLLDPAALLFLASIALGLVLIATSKRRLRAVSTLEGDESGGQLSKKTGIFSVKTTIVAVIWLVGYEIVSAPVFVNPMVNGLEGVYGTYESCPAGSSHIVVLSGGVDSRARTVDSFERMKPATFVRATEGARILSNNPNATLIVSGGRLFKVPEAEVIGHYLTTIGIPKDRLILENRSRNTYENAVNVAVILTEEDVRGPIVLVTSAMHMLRAVKSFELALKDSDITICPASVDYQGLPSFQTYGWVPQMTALVKFDHMLHELVALLMYRLKGWL